MSTRQLRPSCSPPRSPVLMARAAAVRDRAFGTRMTFSPKVFIPLTMLCRDRCGYCTFAKAPARIDVPLPRRPTRCSTSPGRAGRRVPRGAVHPRRGTRGPLPGGPGVARRPRLRSTVDYLAAACAAVLDETGLLPHANAGALHGDELAALRPVSASQGMMLESPQPATSTPTAGPRQGARPGAWPPSRRRGARRSRSPRASSSASASPGRTASTRSRPSPPATPATATSRR